MSEWRRVSKSNRCTVCGKPDWCTYTERYACCMRVESNRPLRNGGWLHPKAARSDGTAVVRPRSDGGSAPDLLTMMRQWRLSMTQKIIRTCAIALGVTERSLSCLGVGWSIEAQAMAFPMYDGARLVGIRLRSPAGEKWAVAGSRSGLFLPSRQPHPSTLLICEGPTDTAAAIDLGYAAIGRPSCLGCEFVTLRAIRKMNASRVVVLSDNDDPGIRGACRLANFLWSAGIRPAIAIPPEKDLRQWVNHGADRSEVERLIEAMTNEVPR